ncbi:MAG: hypothetical protein HYT62_04095 [Candidatus Yanofskybacteria bacterium]|nr:hypothetical protein [Candidatus Yanofskybacteria bacterium]
MEQLPKTEHEQEARVEKSKEEIRAELKQEVRDLVKRTIAETAQQMSNPTRMWDKEKMEAEAKVEKLLEKIDQL